MTMRVKENKKIGPESWKALTIDKIYICESTNIKVCDITNNMSIQEPHLSPIYRLITFLDSKQDTCLDIHFQNPLFNIVLIIP